VDYEQLARRARLVVDLRGVTRSSSTGNVVRL
jgi:anti-anti-sigma regulatory factor